ncbi:unnamed protein product [Lampetra planeri]
MGDIYDPLNPTEEDDIELSPEPTPSVPVQSRPTPGLQSAGLQAPQRTGAVRNSKIDLKNKSRQKICFSIAPNKILKLRPLAIANEAENLWEEKNLSLSTQEGSDMNAPSTSSQAPAVGSEGDLPSPDAQLSQSFTPPKEFKIEWNKMHYKKAHLIGNVARSVDQKPDGANAGGVDVSGGDDETSKAVVNTEAAETGDKLVLAEISSDSELTPVQPVSSVVIAAEIIVKDPPDATELTLTTKESNSQQTGNAQKSGQIIEVLQNSERCKIVSYRNIKVDVQSQKVKRKASRWDIPKDAEKPGEQTIDSPLNKDALSSNVLAPKTSDSLVGTMQSCLPTTVVDASIIDESKEAVLDSAPEHKTASVASACSDVISSSQFEQPTQDDVISEEMCLSIEENNDTSLNQPVQFQISTENDVPPEPHVSVTESTKCNEQADDEKDMTESCSSHSLSASRTSSPTRSAQADPTLPLACSMDDESTHKSDTESDSEDESDGEYRYPRVKLQSVVVVPATSLAAAAEGDSRTPSIVHQSDSSSKDSSDVDEMHKTSDKVTESDSTDGGESPECQPTNDEVAEHHLDSSKADTVQTSENKEIHGVDVEEPQNKQDKGTCKPDKNNDTVEKSQEQDHVELEKEINADDLEDTEMPDASDDVSNVEHTSVIDDEKTKSIPDKETVHVNEISPPPCVTKQTLDVENKELATLEVYISTSGENDCLTPAADEKHVGQSTEVVIGSIDTSGNDPSVVKSESIDIVDEAQIDPLQTSNIGTLSHPISEKCQENKDDSKIVKSQTQEVRSKDGLEMQHKSVSKSDTKSEKQETSCKVLGTVEKTNVQGSSKERSERSGDGKQGSRDVSSRQRNSLDRQRKSQERSSGQSKAQESVSQRGSSKEKSDAHRRSDRSRSRDCTERSRDRVRRPSRSREHASRRSRSRNRMEKRSRSRERASRRSRSRNRSDRSRDRQERRSRSKDRPERRSRSKNRSDRLRDWPDRRSRSRDRSDRRSRSRDRLDRRSRSRNRSDKVRDVVDRRSRSRGRARRSRERVERRSRSRDRSDRRSRSRDRTERLDKRSRSRDRTDRRGRFIERTRGRSRDRTDRRSHSRDRNPRAHSKERGGGGGRSRSRDRGDRHTSFRSERRQSPTHHEPSKTSSQSSQNHARDAPEKRDSGDKSGHPTSSSCSNSNAENRHSSHKASESSSSKQHSASGVTKKEVKDESKLQQGKTPKSRRRRVISDSESDSETDSGDAKLDGTTDGEINKQTEVFEELNWPMENFEDAAKWKAMAAEGRMPSYFDILGENHYLSERKKSKSHRDIKKMKCECSMSEEEREQGLVACGEDCLNRLLMIECSSRCPTGELCTNRRFQKREYAKVEVFKTDKKGWGLRTSVDLQAGTFVLEYCGEVLDYKEFKTRAKEYARNKNIHFYFMALKNEEIIDATLKGNCSRFMNHSCDPNCETQKWTVNGQLRVGFFSRRLVPAGTELTFDYQFQRYGKEAQKCFCGSANCRGVLGGENRTSVRSSVGKGQRTKEKDRTRKKDSLDEELESLQESGEGLTHQRDVLCLLRLMVRTETMEQRHTCLQILQNTQSQACLKHFLEYHGLPLLWSWMAEAGDIRGISSTIAKLQIEIIKTLQHLPIPNRTILEKSKVLGVIERWASCSPGLAPAAEVDGYSSENASQAMSARNSPAPLELSRSQELRKTLDATSIAGSPVQSEAGRAADVAKPTDQGQGKAPDGSKAMDGSLKTRLYRRLKLFNESSTDSVASDVSKVSDGEEEPKDVAEVEVKGQEAVGGEPKEEKIESDEKEPKEELEQKVAEVEKVENEETKVKEEKEETETLQPEEQTEVKEEDGAENVDALAIAPLREIGSHDEEEAGSDVESERSQEPDHHSPVTIAQLAAKLLHSWKDLKEVYRIPKKSRPKSDHGRKAHGRDGTSSRDRESTSRDSGDKRSTPREREREKRKVQTPSSSYDKLGVKRQHSAERYDPDLGTPAKRKPPPPPNGPKLTTEERRRLFEQRAAEEEAQKQVVFMQQQQQAAAAAMAAAGLFQPCDTNFMTSYSPQVLQQQQAFQPGYAHGYPVHPHLEQSQHVNARKVLLPTPSPMQDPSVMQVAQDPMDLTRVEALAQPLPVVMQQIQQQQLQQLQQQQLQQQLLQQQLQQQQYPNAQDTATLLAMDPAILPAAMAGGVQVQATAAGWDAAYAAIPQQYVAAGQPQQTIVYQAQAVPQQQPAYTAATQFAQQQAATYVQTGAGYVQQGQQYYPATAQPVVQAAPGAPAVAVAYQQPVVMETVQQTAMIATCNVMELPPPSPPKPKVISLPPNWRTATDQEGKIYYYHVVSRVTQWDPPAWEGDSDEVGGDRESEMDLGTPTYDETPTKASKKPKTAEADTSSELAKKNKETFRKELSQLIVHCLNAFRKPDCKIGKITNTEDFKYLARKLTHGVMSKEMKLCQNPEDLECNENVKHKTKEYIKKYMTKFGAVYKPKDEPADPE